MVNRCLCLNCGGVLVTPTQYRRRKFGLPAWIHEATGSGQCPITFAAPGRGFTPRHEWEASANGVLTGCVVDHPQRFTPDTIWGRLETLGVAPPLEPRLMGIVLLAWARKELIVPTGKMVRSERPARHKGPVREWAPAERQGALLVPKV